MKWVGFGVWVEEREELEGFGNTILPSLLLSLSIFDYSRPCLVERWLFKSTLQNQPFARFARSSWTIAGVEESSHLEKPDFEAGGLGKMFV